MARLSLVSADAAAPEVREIYEKTLRESREMFKKPWLIVPRC